MATPAYQGTGQPLADTGSGWLGRFGLFFGGGGSPAYKGDGQPSSGGVGGYLGGGSPAYASAPTATQPTIGSSHSIAAQAPTDCPIDPDALVAGSIAIVIPREYLGREQ